MTTKQEEAWAGEFGNEYNARSPGNVENNVYFFHRALGGCAHAPESIMELGAGQGANMLALRTIYPGAELGAVELNRQACEKLTLTGTVNYLVNASILDWEPERTWELAFSKGLLIHIQPAQLWNAYGVLYRCASRWILICEYYNPKPVEVEYRGQAGLLYKRDFAGDMLDAFKDLRLVDYGFVYRRDSHPQDDLHFFLLEKS